MQNVNTVPSNLVILVLRLLNRNPMFPFLMQTHQAAALGDNQAVAMREQVVLEVVPLQKTSTSREVGELEAGSPGNEARSANFVSLPPPESFAHFSPGVGASPSPQGFFPLSSSTPYHGGAQTCRGGSPTRGVPMDIGSFVEHERTVGVPCDPSRLRRYRHCSQWSEV